MKKVLAALFAVALFSTACAQSKKKEEVQELKFKEGQHYEVVSETRSEKDIVTEYFSHYCGHCFQFENFVDTVKAGINADFVKSHVSYIPQNDSVVAMSMVKAFVIMQELGVEKTLSPQMFSAVHLGEEMVDSEEKIKGVFLLNDITSEKYDELYNSQTVYDKAKRMSEVWLEKRITSVPTLVVNEKYKINMGSVASIDELIELTNELLSIKQ